MGMMPENRERRWSSVFRRYGSSDVPDKEEPTSPEKESRQERVRETLLPDTLLKTPSSKRTRNPRSR